MTTRKIKNALRKFRKNISKITRKFKGGKKSKSKKSKSKKSKSKKSKKSKSQKNKHSLFSTHQLRKLLKL